MNSTKLKGPMNDNDFTVKWGFLYCPSLKVRPQQND